MAKSIVPRPPSKRAPTPATKARATRKRRQLGNFHDKLRTDLGAAKAVVMTAVLALQGAGVHNEVAIALRGVVRDIVAALDSIDEQEDRPHA